MEDEDMTPFWLQTTDNRRRRRRQASSFFFNTGILIILLLVIAFAFVFIIIPSFLSFTSKVFKPHLVKKSWDSVNLVLVLFAIICGFLNLNSNNDNNDSRSAYEDYRFSSTPKHVHDHDVGRSNPSTPRQWYDYPSSSSDRKAYNSLQRVRSSNSYPDLRLESSWVMNNDDRWRFYDDTHLYNYRSRSRRENDQEQVYINNTKDIVVHTVQTSSPAPSSPQPASPPPAVAAATAPPLPPQSPPPQPSKVVRRKPKRTYDFEDLKPKEKSELKEVIYSDLKIRQPIPPPSAPARPPSSPPPPPPLPPPIAGSEKRSNKSEKKRGGVTKEFLISLRRKKKKQRQRSVENLDEFFNLSTFPLYPPQSPAPPPPPPPPPLPSFYQSIFSSKKSKARKLHSVRPLAPTAPPLEARASKREPQKSPVTTQKLPLPVKISNINNVEESIESGNESPLNPIPPPPPPPPFKMAPWKFEVHGDFVRLRSINSSRSRSPDLDDPLSDEVSPSDGNKMGEIDYGDSTAGPSFCRSPDVDTKADNFIARFRAGLKLEKINSVRGRSNLGPGPDPSTV
ncbi:serine/arginine repetitive matrix protein 1 [Durio zibethinus]|uniref:Serine/arginine repetitive matrix protein 1 n=1 Tax=Durio zibethinus TaxID=66656 RepID=A0A6P5WGG5_DURZI|nr:serine/arginine repetitive matrix protein 1 [Durio zibethinus]